MLLIRSPSRNQCDPDFSVRVLRSSIGATNSFAFREPTRPNFFSEQGRTCTTRRSRVELNLEALACHPNTTEERIRAPWNVFFFFPFFPFFFSLVFCIPFKVVLPYKHHISHAQTTIHIKIPSKDPKLKQYRTAFPFSPLPTLYR